MIRTFLLILSFILIAVGFGPLVFAQTDGPITAENVYAFSTAEGAKTGAVFMILKNAADADDALTSARTDVSDIVELHENSIDNTNGRMTMRKVEAITVPANGAEFLEPKGKHIMLIGLKQPLKEGTNFTLSLTFKNAGVVALPVKIVPAGDVGGSDHGHHGAH